VIAMRLRFGLPILAVVLGSGLIAANVHRFVIAKPEIRTKDLAFLPSPVVAEMMAIGHRNTVAKLRWIDSFAYFQFQLDRRDDTIAATGERAFERLYLMLIRLDPRFVPFYDGAALNLGGITNRQGALLGMFLEGLTWLPHETSLWRQTLVTLKSAFRLEEGNPTAMNGMLDAWEAAETTQAGKEMVWDWKAAFARRIPQGLEQVPFWLEQLHRAKPGSAPEAYALAILREQVARYGQAELRALAAMTFAHELRGCLAPQSLARRYPDGLPGLGPISVDAQGQPVLRCDPYGFAWEWQEGLPTSRGLEHVRLEKMGGKMREKLYELAISDGSWPSTLAAAEAVGLVLPKLPDYAHWRLDGRQIILDLPKPTEPAWTFPR